MVAPFLEGPLVVDDYFGGEAVAAVVDVDVVGVDVEVAETLFAELTH